MTLTTNMLFFTYFDGCSVAFGVPGQRLKLCWGRFGMEMFGNHQITAHWSMMTSPYLWAHDLTRTRRFYRGVRVSTGECRSPVQYHALRYRSSELNLSWHLSLLPEPLPNFVRTRAWTKNPLGPVPYRLICHHTFWFSTCKWTQHYLLQKQLLV